MNVCVDLSRYVGDHYPFAELQGVTPKSSEAWCDALACLAAVGDGSTPTPLVLDGKGRLYLYRYYLFQKEVAQFMLKKAAQKGPNTSEINALSQGLQRLFPSQEFCFSEPDHQKRAAAVALTRKLTIIAGGPGTGKTTTVSKILALYVERYLADYQRLPRIVLAAPTGKAAARLMESMRSAAERLKGSVSAEVIDALPREASTIHRILAGFGRGKSPFEPEETLGCELLVVDEASMVDLPLMGRLCRVIAPETHVIFMGDRNQLASVEAGSVLGDLCHGKRGERVSLSCGALLEELTESAPQTDIEASPLADAVTTLVKSYRFGKRPGIGDAADASNRGDAQALARVDSAGFSWMKAETASEGLDILRPLIKTYFQGYMKASTAEERLDILDRFRILCAVRKGPLGVRRLNAFVERLLGVGEGLWYSGRPVMVTENDYTLSLFNGDTGVTIREKGEPVVAFPEEGGGMRTIHPARLPSVETVFAMTVHKSQGSEFDHVALVLPEIDTPLLSRELIYTGLTRAKEEALLLGSTDSVEKGLKRRTRRASGLQELLWASPV